ncbi:hypothetical protein AAFC00_006483 [Neodothiora populina]
MSVMTAIILAIVAVVSALPNHSYNVTSPSNSTGKTVTYDWSIGWTTAAPDGFERPVIGINGEWPCPTMRVDYGDRVIVRVTNNLGNQSTSIHWHGIFQYGSSEMDGTVGTSQCPIAPGQTMEYDWIANQTGTYWYHSHDSGQYPDGLWGPLIIDDPNPPFEYDEELIITLSDWYHEQMPHLIEYYQSHQGEAYDGTPTPAVALFNSGVNVSVLVKPDTTYLVRIICPAAFSGVGFIFDQHETTTVELDGRYTVPVTSKDFERVAAGQRQAVLLKTKNDTSTNYAFWGSLDVNMLFLDKGTIPPQTYNTNVTAWLVYNEDAPLPDPPVFATVNNDQFYEDLDYQPLDGTTVFEPVDRQLILDTSAANISGISRYTINGETYLGADVPSLYTALTVGDNYSSDPTVYGETNPYVFKYGEIIEIVINNQHTNLHPWHMHGHEFQVLERTNPDTGSFPGYYTNYSNTPVFRDTIMLQPNSYAVIRFKADNPGVWLFHCHIEFHVPAGLTATFIEAPEMIGSGGASIPQNHIDICKAVPQAYEGNAAGNTVDALNLTGAPEAVPQDQYG